MPRVSRGIDAMVAFYDRTLLWVLRHQRATLLVAVATLVADGLASTSIVPKGFLPLQDTGVIIGVTEAAPTSPSPR